LRVAVIGLGSMGKRRIRLLKQYIEKEGKRNGRKNEKWEITGIDLSRERCLEVEELCNIETFSDLDKGLSKGNIDCALICSSPASHAELIHECLKRGLHVFTEMNLVNDRYHENQRLAGEKKRVLFLSSTFLYRKEIEFIKEKLQEKSFGGGISTILDNICRTGIRGRNIKIFLSGRKGRMHAERFLQSKCHG
jgi:predicted dehydrogenase